VLLAVAPEVLAQALRLPSGSDRRAVLVAVLVALTVFLTLLSAGVVRRWRWTFWLILVAFLAGVVRVPVSFLELTGVVPATAPPWYLILQALLGLVQVAIGLAMLAGYRHGGIWKRF
jgi:hypothetical protein